MLVELSVVEQRYHAVMEVAAGAPVVEVAARYGVSRQSVHAWVRKYEQTGLSGLADRSHRPASCPHRIPSAVEALVCDLRRAHPGPPGRHRPPRRHRHPGLPRQRPDHHRPPHHHQGSSRPQIRGVQQTKNHLAQTSSITRRQNVQHQPRPDKGLS